MWRGGDNPAVISFCACAIEYYKASKSNEKVTELQKKLTELKKSIKLKEFSVPIDLRESRIRWQETANQVAKLDPDEIIKLLAVDNNLLPKFKDMESIAERSKSIAPISHMAHTEVIDDKINTLQHFDDPEEKHYFEILNTYSIALQLKSHLIDEILKTIILRKRLTAAEVIFFLKKKSWFGEIIERKFTNNSLVRYTWLDLIAPAIREYFTQMEKYLENPIEYPNLILIIDSLVLKIEGLLREILTYQGISTTFSRRDRKNRRIEMEKDINALLHEQSIKDLIEEDNLLFLRFLLIEKAGYNLRHKAAHSLMVKNEYTIDLANLIFIAILRLAQYDLKFES